MSGLILVFDLDQTIIDTDSLVEKGGVIDVKDIDKYINYSIVDSILRPAIRLRRENVVDGIFLLTNNGSLPYVENVISVLNTLCGNVQVFDGYRTRNHKDRLAPKDDPPKKIQDVIHMALAATPPIDTHSIAERTYVFDDSPFHTIKTEIPNGHYITIVGPDTKIITNNSGNRVKLNKGFKIGKEDLTDYEAIKEILGIKGSKGKRTKSKGTKGTKGTKRSMPCCSGTAGNRGLNCRPCPPSIERNFTPKVGGTRVLRKRRYSRKN